MRVGRWSREVFLVIIMEEVWGGGLLMMKFGYYTDIKVVSHGSFMTGIGGRFF